MADEIIPDELRDFILKHIDSITQLEALILLRARPDADWDAKRTAARLYASEQEIADVLARLCADGLLVCEGELYRYHCATDELATMVDRLAEAYAHHLIPVTNMIHAKPRRIRAFADAFKFRKDR